MGKHSNKYSIEELMRMYFDSFLNGEEFYSSIGKVVSADENEATCSVELSDGTELDGVRLQQVKNDNGLFIKPSVGSSIVVSWTDNTTAFISLCSEVDEILFQNGENGGLIKIVEQTAKLNSLVSEMQAELVKIAAGITGVGGAYTPGTISVFNKSDFENEKFKH